MANNYRGYYRRPIIPPQQEKKAYDIWTEVIIPAIQALIVVWLCDVAGGLVLYLVVYIGPATVSTVLGGLIMLGTVWVVGFSQINYQAKFSTTTIGVLIFAVQQYALVRLAKVWPWHWREPLQMWHAWVHTLWIGPLIGGGVLIWRFVNEIFDPFWPRIPMYPEEPKPARQPRLASSKMIITKYRDGRQEAEEPPVTEDVWIPPERGHTLQAHLKSFIVGCARKGTSKANWLPKGEKYHLSTGLRVTRNVYDDMMEILRGIGIFKWGGPGEGLEWTCSAQEAITVIEENVDE